MGRQTPKHGDEGFLAEFDGEVAFVAEDRPVGILTGATELRACLAAGIEYRAVWEAEDGSTLVRYRQL